METRYREYAKEFATETTEAFIVILLFNVLSDNKIDRQTVLKTTKVSMLVGVISTIFFAVDARSHEKLKDGMRNAVGASVIASAIGR